MVACLPTVSRADLQLKITPAYPALSFDDNATALAITPGKNPRAVVAFQRGQIRVLPEDKDSADAPLFLDLREKMREETGFEEGLHGLAFHPSFATERRVFVCYSQRDPRRTVLSEFKVPAEGPLRADPASEQVLLDLPHPIGNHWGGGIAFGPDGYLYISIGDGGVRDDPYRLGQNLWTLHGKILRIDINGRTSFQPYKIPPDNPFVDKQEIRDEIWATGFRNPWGMSFDKVTGTLWCGDVGQDAWEEVNLVKAGGNYGWSEREGPARFEARANAPQENTTFIDPIHSYAHSEGISVTGGFVYRGKRFRGLKGSYLFGDWGTGIIWSLSWNPKDGTAIGTKPVYTTTPDGIRFNPTVIAADAAGEPLFFSHSPSIIYTLADSLLADAEISEDAQVEEPPTPEDATELPGDPETTEGES
ncbi:PQQ-dependent sugar dehydrogenase [Luteolibacter yonseiensis]